MKTRGWYGDIKSFGSVMNTKEKTSSGRMSNDKPYNRQDGKSQQTLEEPEGSGSSKQLVKFSLLASPTSQSGMSHYM